MLGMASDPTRVLPSQLDSLHALIKDSLGIVLGAILASDAALISFSGLCEDDCAHGY